jgi:rhodanese-related sulfurtransferase
MVRRLVRVLVVTLLAVIVLALVGVVVFFYYDQTTLAAQARATPQVPPEAAAGQENPIPVDLPPAVNVTTIHLLNGRSDVVVLDVRAQSEYDQGHLPGAMLIPLSQLPARMNEVPRDCAVIAYCQTGHRSAQAVELLQGAGFSNVHSMIGGLRAWAKAGFEIEQ